MAIGGLHSSTREAARIACRHPDYERRAELLRKLWPTGKPVIQIAAEIGGGMTKNGVAGMARRLGLPQRGNPVRQLTPEERAKRLSATLEQQARLRVRAHGPTAKAPRNGPLSPAPPAENATTTPGRYTCQYIYNDGKPWMYCGQPGYPWCEHHRGVVFTRPKEAAALVAGRSFA